MTVRDVQKVIEEWAPKEIAWESDNVGLQVGSPDATIRSILVCLDVTEATIREAEQLHANLIISHHPLLFRPPRAVDLRARTGRCIAQLLKSDINLFSVHTNLDFTRGGTSFALAERLGLRNVDFLFKSYRLSKKIVTFVPSDQVDHVAQAMADAGAGRIGNYELCSFRTQGTGTFRGNERSSPTMGRRGTLEYAREVRLEMIADQPRVQSVVRAMVDAHPYEEVAYDVYPLENISNTYGMGAIGELVTPMSMKRFTLLVRQALGSKAIRSSSRCSSRIGRVAVCGGSGGDLMDEAIRQSADAFVTADVKYHSFQDASDRILLVDAGHYETERPVVDCVAKRLNEEFTRERKRIAVHTARFSSNPILYH